MLYLKTNVLESVCSAYNENIVGWIGVMGLSTPSVLSSGLEPGPVLPFNFATFHWMWFFHE